jgi:uncharacterized protein DUF5946
MADRCSGCGSKVPGGSEGCQQLFDGRMVLETGDLRYARLHRMVVDCYCLQHPAHYCVSAKSLMAHLAGLCVALELGADDAAYRALQRSLDGRPDIAKPMLPERRGTVTIADVLATSDPESYAQAVNAWAADIWQAHAPLHEHARRWLRTAVISQCPDSRRGPGRPRR